MSEATGSVLLVTAEQSVRESLARHLRGAGIALGVSDGLAHALTEIRRAKWDVCLTDLSNDDEAQLRRDIQARSASTLVLPLTHDRVPSVQVEDGNENPAQMRFSLSFRDLVVLIRTVLNARRVQDETMHSGNSTEATGRLTESNSFAPLDSSKGIKSLHEIEKDYILHVLEYCRGNRTRASELLGIDRVTLYHKLKQYGWRRDQEGQGPFRG